MWYYVTLSNVCIGVFNSVNEVNHFLIRKGYTIINIHQKCENETIVEVVHTW